MELDPKKLKEAFNKMSEIDENPESKESKEFLKKLYEYESKQTNSRRKPAPIIVKTIKRGKTIKTEKIVQKEMDAEGKEVSAEDAEFARKYVDYNKIKWPERNTIEMERPDYKGIGTVKLQTYRYPDLSDSPKGIVTFLHGYGDYSRYAYLGKIFGENGYEFHTID